MVIIGLVTAFVGLDLAAIKWGKNSWLAGSEQSNNYDPRYDWNGLDQ